MVAIVVVSGLMAGVNEVLFCPFTFSETPCVAVSWVFFPIGEQRHAASDVEIHMQLYHC